MLRGRGDADSAGIGSEGRSVAVNRRLAKLMRTRSSILVALIAVFALGAAGCGSEDPAAVVVDTVAPAAVLDVDAQVSAGGIDVTWAAASEADLAGYHVYRSVNGDVATLVGSVSTNAFTDIALGSGLSFRYEVAAYDAAGNVGPRAASVILVVRDLEGPRRGSSLGD
jgi:fibronectin type 3 domain-containing protein